MKSSKLLAGISAILLLGAWLQAVRVGMNFYLPQAVSCNSAGPFGWGIPPAWLVVLGVLALIFLAVQWWRESNTFRGVLWLLLLGAGLSNVWERLSYGCVSDYFSLGFSFNAADSLLTLGVLALLYGWQKRRKPN